MSHVGEGSNIFDDSLPPGDEKKDDSGKTPGCSTECSTQKDQISPKLRKRLEKGDQWYLLDVRWFKQWKKYVGFEASDQGQMGAESAHPGPVYTSTLFKDRDQDVLKDHLMEDLDYSLVPEEVWKTFVAWYGIEKSSQPIPRKVVEHGLYVKHCKVEVYLVEFKLALHPEVDVVHTKKFSRVDTVADIIKVMKETFSIPEEKECRLWLNHMRTTYEMLSELNESILDAGLYPNQLLLLEQKKDDGTWPQQTALSSRANMSSIRSDDVRGASNGSSSVGSSMRSTTSGMSSSSYWGYDQPSEPGVCGLSNLGNASYTNTALQCLSNTYTLTEYFLKDAYRKHINEKNPLGMGGNLAKAYGSFLHEMWSGKTSCIHPRNLKATIGKFAPQFAGYNPHDSSELLAFVLDGLHEDLNQVLKKPYVDMDIKSEGREDKEIAQEAWTKYLMRNKSVVVKLFWGQLKCTMVCPDCNKVSREFNPFMCMSLPIPFIKTRELVIRVVRSNPIKRIEEVKITVPKHGQISALLAEVSKQTGVNKDRMFAADVYNCRFHKIFDTRANLGLIMDKDDIYCYEVQVTSAQDPNFTVIAVYNREKIVRTINYTHGSSNTSIYHQLFGVPLLVTVPRDGLTYRTLYGILLDHMRRYVKKQTNTKPDKITGPSEAGYDEADKQVGNADDGLMDSGKNNHNNKPSNDNNTEAKIEVGKGKYSSEEKKEETKATKPEDYFTMSIVDAIGSQVLRNLVDDDAPLKLNNNTYVACDWDSNRKKEHYDLAEAEFKVNHSNAIKNAAEEKKKNIHLLDCVKFFTVEEQLGEEYAWYCKNCKMHKPAFKKTDLWKLPEILVIHLKRATYSRYCRDKLDVLVDYPIHELDLSNELINPDEPKPIYDLYAVTNHHGGMAGGHYTAYAKNPMNGKWYHFDDSKVSEIDERHVVTSAAYVLFYERHIEGQPVLPRRMTHREPSQDKPDKKEKTSSSVFNDSNDGAGAAVIAAEVNPMGENNSSATDDVFNNNNEMDS
ncbi:ubiquitin carboxyl-terminal hydrolase 4-like isoform X2 [Dysidea avara]|uniref:ubiquitin carboxyl-terminal hydrolase 4-like isoform X2 n=1 Tax=Dysidea avara TaxID=196820 RepID=UPI00332737CD